MGIDAGPLNELQLEERWNPIQVKQKMKESCPDIDSFEAMMSREECQGGFFISFGSSSYALTEINRFFKQTKSVFTPLTVQEFLD